MPVKPRVFKAYGVEFNLHELHERMMDNGYEKIKSRNGIDTVLRKKYQYKIRNFLADVFDIHDGETLYKILHPEKPVPDKMTVDERWKYLNEIGYRDLGFPPFRKE